jgi:energy-coupling factor transporter ATP-binding protein EcfA2
MNKNQSKIKRIEIKSLWGKYDLAWDLNSDVNILSGINGSGKSTVLNAILNAVKPNIMEVSPNIRECSVLFSDESEVIFETKFADEKVGVSMNQLILDLQKLELGSEGFKVAMERYTKEAMGRGQSIHTETGLINLYGVSKEYYEHILLNMISTFDQEVYEDIKKPHDDIRTELDWQINNLQADYLDYQLDIGKRAFKAVSSKKNSSQKEVLQIKQRQDRFIEIVNDLFKETEKRIDEEENELSFLMEDEILSPYQLSAGEKQLLVILMTVLVQDDEPSILLMDEPEISLHFDWQKKLIGYILELNPNVQIIIATHSPALIIEGWTDKVFEMKNLIVKETATAQ